MHIGANDYLKGLVQMDFSDKTAIVTGAPSQLNLQNAWWSGPRRTVRHKV
jgi:hypothetical protein